MKGFLKLVAHTALGGASVALYRWAESGQPITTGTVLVPAAISALTCVFALMASPPQIRQDRPEPAPGAGSEGGRP